MVCSVRRTMRGANSSSDGRDVEGNALKSNCIVGTPKHAPSSSASDKRTEGLVAIRRIGYG